MRIEGKDYTQCKDDVLVIRLPDAVEPSAIERIKRALGMSQAGFEVSILPPTKRLYDELTTLVEDISKAADEADASEVDLNDALDIVSRLMSRNAEKRAVTPQQLDEMGFDLEDVGEFIGSYVFFVNELVRSKN